MCHRIINCRYTLALILEKYTCLVNFSDSSCSVINMATSFSDLHYSFLFNVYVCAFGIPESIGAISFQPEVLFAPCIHHWDHNNFAQLHVMPHQQ